MPSQDAFQELHFVPDPVLGDDVMVRTEILMHLKGSLKIWRKKACIYCNLTDPLYNSPSVKCFHIFPDIFIKQNKNWRSDVKK